MALNNTELLKPRFKVINNYPDCEKNKHFVGDIISFAKYDDQEKQWYNENWKSKIYDAYYEGYPHLFKRLEWWQERTIEQLTSVKFAKVITYRGYWRIGDIVPIEKFIYGSIEDAKPTGYELQYRHYQPIFELEPATSEEYNTYLSLKKK